MCRTRFDLRQKLCPNFASGDYAGVLKELFSELKELAAAM